MGIGVFGAVAAIMENFLLVRGTSAALPLVLSVALVRLDHRHIVDLAHILL
jgi:hypothetical protein